jgi:two-component system osmolarity sensor histidine kinase EnvZ
MASIADIARPARAGRNLWRWFWRGVANWMPKGLFARSLLIIIVPIVLLQAVVAFVFMERHWTQVTARLSEAVTREIAAIINVYESYPQDADSQTLVRIAAEDFGLSISFLPPDPLPPAGPKPFFSLLDRTLSEEITRQIARPFWIDTVGKSNLVEIRIKLDDAVLRVFARRSQAYASNSHIFIVWMIGTSLVLLAVAVAFLRNQIKPILRLAEAAETFGKGRDVEDFRPRGAREVRRAALAFLEMKRRIERQMEQRTTMLAGVSHDLRTILTRFKLELALLGDSPEIEMMTTDVDEMQRMLEEYMAFARGDSGEQSEPVDMLALFETLKSEAERSGHQTTVNYSGEPTVTVRPQAFKRCLGNLVDNACDFGDEVRITGVRGDMWLTVIIDDDGPGVPEDLRESVFKPFYRLDDSRNQDRAGTGLGLAIARDVARSHGGEISLSESPAGGLRVTVRMPV